MLATRQPKITPGETLAIPDNTVLRAQCRRLPRHSQSETGKPG